MTGATDGLAVSDPLNEYTSPDLHWTTANVGEAVPEVLTPLTWSLWGPVIDRGMREAFYAMGAIAKSDVVVAPEDRLVRVFRGRGALLVEDLARLGDRMPGTSAEKVVSGIFGEMPTTMKAHPTVRWYPRIAWGTPRSFLSMPPKLRASAADTGRWWRATVGGVATLDHDAAVRVFNEAAVRFQTNVTLQATTLFCAVQPMYELLDKLCTRTGAGDVTALAGGYGDVPELAVVRDLWLASRGQLELSEVVARHGFHGPLEGELSSRIWREDDTPLRKLLAQYALRSDDDDPMKREVAQRDKREEIERNLLAGMPPVTRPLVRALLARAAVTIPLRGVAKGAFLMSFDVARAAARRLGELLAVEGVLHDQDDVFYLTVDELIRHRPDDVKALVAQRRVQREAHLAVRLPEHWRGTPIAQPIADTETFDDVSSLTGTGTSAGIIEGLARVVLDPADADVESGEILVASTTDPSWSSIMFISAGLVVDIGGAVSHASVVARELGIPCVVNTKNGSRVLRTGDLIRIDGTAGTVEILHRADAGSVVSLS